MTSTLERLLLCTDLDRTLIPNGTQSESAGARHHFTQLARQPQVTVTYVSGRHRELVQHAIEEYQLPQPQYVIGDVGTTIYAVSESGRWSPLKEWEESINESWQHVSRKDLGDTLLAIDGLQLQEQEKQNTHKLSYYVCASANKERLQSSVSAALNAKKICARQIWSIDEVAGITLLDIVPRRASKYHAIRALQAVQGFSDGDTVFSGDSGNDLEVLASPVPSTLVANSTPEVQRQAADTAAAAGNSEKLYIARGDFRGMNGNYSAGILEGIANYHPETIGWMGFECSA